MTTAVKKQPDPNAILKRKLFALGREHGLDIDRLREFARGETGVVNPQTGEGSISRLNKRQLIIIIDRLTVLLKKRGG